MKRVFWISTFVNDKLTLKIYWHLLVILTAILILPNALIAKSSKRELLIIQAKKNIFSAFEHIDEAGKNLERKNRAHKILSKALGGNMPDYLARELTVEIDILLTLIKSNNSLRKLTAAAQAIVDGRTLEVGIADLDKSLRTLDESLKKLRNTLKTKSEVRRLFKAHLKEVVDTLMLANPDKTNTLITVKTELEPKILDLELMQQRNIIESVLTSLNVLK